MIYIIIISILSIVIILNYIVIYKKDKVLDILCKDNYNLRHGRQDEVDARLKKYFDRFKNE